MITLAASRPNSLTSVFAATPSSRQIRSRVEVGEEGADNGASSSFRLIVAEGWSDGAARPARFRSRSRLGSFQFCPSRRAIGSFGVRTPFGAIVPPGRAPAPPFWA